MPTISVCMIVKNEATVLSRCLDSLKPIADEIIIVDTGSTDDTKKIAATYTDKVYDFTWENDFAAARNFSFKQATKEYIYVADADEVIDEENQKKFLQLKKALLPEIEIVQMMYCNQLQHNTTYNFDKEYRPKLYKRLREFTWRDAIHEAVQLEPVIFDSEIEIMHMPTSNHARRDFHVFRQAIKKDGMLSNKLNLMYARELFIAGSEEDFVDAYSYFVQLLESDISLEQLKVAQCIVVKAARILKDSNRFFKEAMKNIALEEASAEVCFEVGEHYFAEKDYKEASIWFYNAAYETSAELNVHYAGDLPLHRLANCYEALNLIDQAKEYEVLANEWKSEQS